MNLLKSAKRNGITDWRTENGKFSGVLVDPVVLRERGKDDVMELPAAALLAVPKDREGERPSINKYSPIIARGPTSEELGPLISAWTEAHRGDSLWKLRRQ